MRPAQMLALLDDFTSGSTPPLPHGSFVDTGSSLDTMTPTAGSIPTLTDSGTSSDTATIDALSLLSDFFDEGSQNPSSRAWVEVDDSTTPAGDGAIQNIATSITLGSGLLMQVDAGGGTGSFWLHNNRGSQWWRGVGGLPISDALWAVECLVTARNAADSGDPPGTNYRLTGLMAHDIHSDASDDHVALCYGTGNGAFPRVYWAHTVNGSSAVQGNTTPGFNVSATLSGASRYLRMLRDRDNSDRWVLQHKANLGDAWTTIRDVQRAAVSTAMPNDVYVGPVVFSDQPTHDVSGRFRFIRFYTPVPGDFP
jgi:hypothetical protein